MMQQFQTMNNNIQSITSAFASQAWQKHWPVHPQKELQNLTSMAE
jgi:hypothetical protein